MTDASPITPADTWALIVAVESYERDVSLNLDGPFSDACDFADWLRRCEVPVNHITVLASPLGDNIGRSESLEKIGIDFRIGRTLDRRMVEDALERVSGKTGLLVIFWSGHGIQAGATRRALLGNYCDKHKHNLNIDNLQKHLRSAKFEYPSEQLFVFDICACPFDELLYGYKLPTQDFDETPDRELPACQQWVLFACEDGKVAENVKAERTGRFYKELKRALANNLGWPPDIKQIIEATDEQFKRLRKSGEAVQNPINGYWRTPSGRTSIIDVGAMGDQDTGHFEIERYDIALTIAPKAKARYPVDLYDTDKEMVVRRASVRTDNLATLSEHVRFACDNSFKAPFKLIYRTNGDGFVTCDSCSHTDESDHGNKMYRLYRKMVICEFTPQAGAEYTQEVTIVGGFGATDRCFARHLAPGRYKLITIQLDLREYLCHGYAITREPSLSRHHNENICAKMCDLGPIVGPAEQVHPGVWRWTVENYEACSLNLFWDVANPSLSTRRRTLVLCVIALAFLLLALVGFSSEYRKFQLWPNASGVPSPQSRSSLPNGVPPTSDGASGHADGDSNEEMGERMATNSAETYPKLSDLHPFDLPRDNSSPDWDKFNGTHVTLATVVDDHQPTGSLNPRITLVWFPDTVVHAFVLDLKELAKAKQLAAGTEVVVEGTIKMPYEGLAIRLTDCKISKLPGKANAPDRPSP